MKVPTPTKVTSTKPYSDLDINSNAGNRRNYSDVYSEVTFLPGGFRSFPRPPRTNPSNLVRVSKFLQYYTTL